MVKHLVKGALEDYLAFMIQKLTQEKKIVVSGVREKAMFILELLESESPPEILRLPLNVKKCDKYV